MVPFRPRPLVRENAFYAPSPYKQPKPLQREPAFYPLPISSPPQFPRFQSIGRGTLKRQPAMYNVVPPEQQRSRIPIPIYAQAVAPRPQIYRPPRPAGMAVMYIVPRSSYIEEEEKKVRFGGWTDQKTRRGSGSGRRHHVKNLKSILKYAPPSFDANMSGTDGNLCRTPHMTPRRPRQLLKPGERLHRDGTSSSLYPSFGCSTKVVFKGHHKWVSSGSFATSYWMQVDRWIDQSSVRPGECSVTCRGCQMRVRLSLEQSSLERMQKWKEHKRGCEAIKKAVKKEQLEMSL